jgi:hypothetical protein
MQEQYFQQITIVFTSQSKEEDILSDSSGEARERISKPMPELPVTAIQTWLS